MSGTKRREFSCHKISGGVATGEVLVSDDDICFYMADPETGKIIDDGHALEGRSVAGKVLVFPSGKGSAVVQDEGVFALKERGTAPNALIIRTPDTVLVFGALLAELPVVDQVEPEVYEFLRDGVRVTVDADRGIISILDR